MANFLLMPVGSSGDTNPFIGIGRELRKRGHAVTVFVNGHFRQAVERAGLDYIEAGPAEAYLAMLNNPEIWDPRKGFEAVVNNPHMTQALRAQYALIEERLKCDPRLTVVAGSLALGARIAEEKLGVRLVSLALQPMLFLSVKDPPVSPSGTIPAWLPRPAVRLLYWVIDAYVFGPVIGRVVEPFRRELGLPRARHFLRDWLHSRKLEIGLFPKWFGYADDWPPQVRLTGFPLFDDGADQPLAPDVEHYLNAGEPPIVFTFGSGMRRGERLFAAAMESCEKLQRRGILLTAFREQLPAAMTGGVTHFDYIPLARLLPRCAAIVHHGGIGTTSQALRAGIPQVVTHMSHDQPDNAARVARLGAGRSLPAKCATGETMAHELTQVLDNPEVFAACKEIAQRFAGCDAIAETCRILEDFAKAV